MTTSRYGEETQSYWYGNLENTYVQLTRSLQSKEIGRSSTVLDNFLKNQKNYGHNYRTGRPKVFSKRGQMHIIRCASNSMISARDIRLLQESLDIYELFSMFCKIFRTWYTRKSGETSVDVRPQNCKAERRWKMCVLVILSQIRHSQDLYF